MSDLRETKSPRPLASAVGRDDLAQLAYAACRGDSRATRTFVTAVGPSMLRAIRQVMGFEHPDVEDVLQEACLNVLDALKRFDGGATTRHFACRVAVLTAMNARRRESRLKRGWRWLCHGEVDDVQGSEPALDGALDARNAMKVVRKLMTTLPVAQAEALSLHCVLGCTVEEIASTLSVSSETIRSRLRLAKQALRRKISAEPELSDLVEGAS